MRAEELISGDDPRETCTGSEAASQPRPSARSWISKTVKCRWNSPPAGAKSTYSKQTQPRRATSFEPTANIKTEPVMNIIYQAGTFWRGLLNQSFRYLPGPLIPNPLTSRDTGYLGPPRLAAVLRAVPLSAQNLCGIHLSHE